MFYDTARRDHGMTQDPLTALVVPRPIGWISTLDGQGRVNLAPYSFYNGVGEHPPMVYFSTTGTYGDTPTKHSRLNAEQTGEFVVNMVSADLAEQMNVTTAMVAFGVDELKLAGLTPAPCRFVRRRASRNRLWHSSASTGAPSRCLRRRAMRPNAARLFSARSWASTSTTASSRMAASTRWHSNRLHG